MFYFFSRKLLRYVRKKHAGCTRLVAAISEVHSIFKYFVAILEVLKKKRGVSRVYARSCPYTN